jgi:hypothetical protein
VRVTGMVIISRTVRRPSSETIIIVVFKLLATPTHKLRRSNASIIPKGAKPVPTRRGDFGDNPHEPRTGWMQEDKKTGFESRGKSKRKYNAKIPTKKEIRIF